MRRWTVGGLAIGLSVIGCSAPTNSQTQASTAASSATVHACPVTLANGSTPPGEKPSPDYHGDGVLWTALWPNGRVVAEPDQVLPDGSIDTKFPCFRGPEGQLVVTGHRLDGPSPPLRADILSGFGSSGFQATGLTFPRAGCWEVTGRVGNHSLTFVTLVERLRVRSVPGLSHAVATGA